MLYNLTLCRRCLTRWVSGQHIRLKSHYAVLGVSPNASQKEIRNAFLDLSKKYHPDQNKTNSNSHEKFVQISESYSVLSKPLSRQEYDAKLRYSSASSINNNYQRYPFKGPPPGYQGPPPGYPGYDPYSHDNPFYRGPYGSRGPYSQGQYGQKRPGQGFKEDPFSQHGYEFYQRQREAEYNHAFENFLRYNRRRRQENVKQFRKGLKLFTMWMIVIYILTFLGFLILYSSLLLSGSDSLRKSGISRKKRQREDLEDISAAAEYLRERNSKK